MLSGPPRRRRARPVADAPVDVLLGHVEDLAKGWLLALLEQAPLDEAPSILAAELARDGPRLCDAVLRALSDETDLRRLEPGGALAPLAGRVGEVAGAAGPEAASRAVDALQAVVWAALRDELRSPAPELVSDLAERLALVTEQLRSAALRRAESAPGAPEGPSMRLAPRPPEEDERPSPWPRERPSGAAEAPAQALWIGALTDEIERSEGQPLSLLLAELEEAGRVSAVEGPVQASATFGEFAKAVRSVVRRQDILVCETESRAWIIARDTARGGAQALGTRIAEAVGRRRHWRGAPLVASVGVAVLGDDGETPEKLIEAAEEARFAAEASGIGMAGSVPDQAPPD